jgi:hypothetical protein
VKKVKLQKKVELKIDSKRNLSLKNQRVDQKIKELLPRNKSRKTLVKILLISTRKKIMTRLIMMKKLLKVLHLGEKIQIKNKVEE